MCGTRRSTLLVNVAVLKVVRSVEHLFRPAPAVQPRELAAEVGVLMVGNCLAAGCPIRRCAAAVEVDEIGGEKSPVILSWSNRTEPLHHTVSVGASLCQS